MVWLCTVSRDPGEVFSLEMAEKLSSTSESDFESVNYEYEALTSASIGSNPSVDVITVCQKVLYTIPSFPVITVELRLVKVSLMDGTTNHFHVFMREDEELDDCVPANIEMIETCTVDVSPSSSSLSLRPLNHVHVDKINHFLCSLKNFVSLLTSMI